jgi:NAD(P)-dependent dehydrogenase (short-subunit alcohol dehydrogenase family)
MSRKAGRASFRELSCGMRLESSVTMNRLANRVCIVTGATGGIGEASARLFVAEGAKVVLVDLDEARLTSLAASLGEGNAAVVAGDVADEATSRRAVSLAVERFGGVDVMFANAGVEGSVAPIADYPLDAFDKLMSVNVRGAFLAIRAAAPAIAKRGGGAILLTSSVAGWVGSRGLAPYCASKHAVMGLVKSAAIELAPSKIRVVAINPGPIENRMMRSIEAQAAPGAPETVKSGFEAMVPMGRYGKNEEIARLALFLASDEASYCTGSSFVADGGFLAM